MLAENPLLLYGRKIKSSMQLYFFKKVKGIEEANFKKKYNRMNFGRKMGMRTPSPQEIHHKIIEVQDSKDTGLLFSFTRTHCFFLQNCYLFDKNCAEQVNMPIIW